jgi:hypothetical protein
MSSVLDTITQQLGGGAMQQMSRQLGTDEQTTANAVSMALPVLIGGLAHNAQQPAGAQALHGALAKDHDGSLLDTLGGMLGGGAGAGAMGGIPGLGGGAGGSGGMGGLGGLLAGGAGAAILGHVLGSRRGPVEQGIGRATGMNAGQVGQLLMMLAPIVMAALGRRARQENADPGALGGILAQEQQEVARRAPEMGGLGGLLDRNDDGSIVDDLGRMAPGVLGGLFGKR